MSKRPSNSRQSISSGISIPASLENITSFEEYLTLAHEILPRETSPPPPSTSNPPPPVAATEKKKDSKKQVQSRYGIRSIIARNKAAVSKKDNTDEISKQKLLQAEQQQREQRELRDQRRPSTWRSLIKGVLDLQRGRIPLLLAIEAGNQSMVRELLSAQTAEQLQVSCDYFSFKKKRKRVNCV